MKNITSPHSGLRASGIALVTRPKSTDYKNEPTVQFLTVLI